MENGPTKFIHAYDRLHREFPEQAEDAFKRANVEATVELLHKHDIPNQEFWDEIATKLNVELDVLRNNYSNGFPPQDDKK